MVNLEKEFEEEFGADNRRGTLRCPIYRPARVTLEGKPYLGVTRDISINGAAVIFDLEFDLKPETGTPLEIDIETIGRLSGKVVRHFPQGFGVELSIDHDEEDRLAATLMELLNRPAPGA